MKKLSKCLLFFLRFKILNRSIIYWISKHLLTSKELIDLTYLNFTSGLPKDILVLNSKLSTMLKVFDYLKNDNNNNELFQRFLRNSISNSNILESQFLQDCFVDTLFEGIEGGCFIEIGVGDGKRISNTYFLEKYRNWHGLLCEPSLRWHESIISNRAAFLVKNAITNRSGEILKFAEVLNDGEQSTLLNFLNSDGHDRANFKEYDVLSSTFDDVVSSNLKTNIIDYLSIDTEGSELDIISGIDFKKYEIRCISVEHNYESKKLDKIREILINNNYVEIGFYIFSEDVFFVKNNLVNSL